MRVTFGPRSQRAHLSNRRRCGAGWWHRTHATCRQLASHRRIGRCELRRAALAGGPCHGIVRRAWRARRPDIQLLPSGDLISWQSVRYIGRETDIVRR
jgi:hypothetical protein